MRHRTIIILLSLCIAFVFMTSGYSLWEKSLVIKTNIDVVAPPPPPPEKKEADGKDLKDPKKDNQTDTKELQIEIIENKGEEVLPPEPAAPEIIQEENAQPEPEATVPQEQGSEIKNTPDPAVLEKGIGLDPVKSPNNSSDTDVKIDRK